MKNSFYIQSGIGIFLIAAMLSACNKQDSLDRQTEGKPGHYVFTGSTKCTLDSQYVADTTTHQTERLVIDSSFTDAIDVIVDKQYISFNFRSGTFTERLMGYLNYRFPINGPYSHTDHSIYGTSYSFTFSGEDSLHFDYRNIIVGGYFLYKKLEFKGGKVQ